MQPVYVDYPIVLDLPEGYLECTASFYNGDGVFRLSDATLGNAKVARDIVSSMIGPDELAKIEIATYCTFCEDLDNGEWADE